MRCRAALERTGCCARDGDDGMPSTGLVDSRGARVHAFGAALAVLVRAVAPAALGCVAMGGESLLLLSASEWPKWSSGWP
eukprot:5158868-Pleurochrysis_carterae.AAC.1